MKYELINYCEFDKYAAKAYSLIHNEPEGKNLGDITLVNEKEIDDFNMMVGGSPCFVAGTKVITNKGYKNIEDLKVGDMVLTHKNRFMPVVRVGRNSNKDIYKIKAQGILPIIATDNHPFYIRTRNRLWNNNRRSYDRSYSEPYKKRVSKLTRDDYIGIPILQTEENPLELNMEECWFLGRYVADGHFVNYKRKDRPNSYNREIIISVGLNKIGEFKQKIKNIQYNSYLHTKSCYRISCRDTKLWNIIKNYNFGKCAIDKDIPTIILNLPVDLLREFLSGYLSGDGCKIQNKIQATTISKNLAMNLCLVVQKVYRVGCSIYFDKRPNKCIIGDRVVNQSDTYMIRFDPSETKQRNYEVIEDIVWYPIREIVDLNSKDDVYNIEVELDHTYTANNAITFNCQDFSVAGKGKGAVWTCKDCKDDEGNEYQYNPLEVHYTKRDRCPKCNSTNIEKTRSSLVVEWLRILLEKEPNVAIYENVKNLVGKKHKYFFDLFISELHEYGYNTYWKVLNAKDYGIPQNRERVYLIIIKKELDNGKFRFPEGFDNGIRLKDLLEKEVDEKYYISEDKTNKLIEQLKDKEISNTVRTGGHGSTDRHMWDLVAIEDNGGVVLKVGNVNPSGNGMNGCVYSEEGVAPTVTTNKGEGNKIMQVGNIVDTGNFKNPQRGRIYSSDGICPALNTVGGGGLEPKILEEDKSIQLNHTELPCILDDRDRGFGVKTSDVCPTQRAERQGIKCIEPDYRIRKLIPLECFRLMGFQDKDFYILKENKISDTQCYKMAGNSIVVDVLYYIYLELYKAMPHLFEDIKLGSFFSGIGAFEKAIKRLLEETNKNESNDAINY